MKAASIQETPTTEINKKTSSSCQAHNTDAQNCYKNARKCPSELDCAVFGVIVASELLRHQRGFKCRFLAYQSASMRGVNYLKAQSVLSGVLSVLAQLPLSAAYTP